MFLRILLHALLWPVLLVTIAWDCAVLWIDGPSSRPVAGTLAGVFVLAALVVLIRFRPLRRGVVAYGVLFFVVLGWWLSIPPSNDRDWQRDVAELATATIDGDLVKIRNVVYSTYGCQKQQINWPTGLSQRGDRLHRNGPHHALGEAFSGRRGVGDRRALRIAEICTCPDEGIPTYYRASSSIGLPLHIHIASVDIVRDYRGYRKKRRETEITKAHKIGQHLSRR